MVNFQIKSKLGSDEYTNFTVTKLILGKYGDHDLKTRSTILMFVQIQHPIKLALQIQGGF